MRTLILVVLASGTLYYAWTRFGGTDPVTGETTESTEVAFPSDTSEASKGGVFMTYEDMEPAAEEEKDTVSVAASTAVEQVPDPEVAEEDPDRDIFDLTSLGDPVFEGSLLLHRPGELQSYLDDRGKGLSRSRKKLLISYLLLSRGQYGQVSNYTEGLEEAADVTAEEMQLLRSAVERKPIRIREASSRLTRNPLMLGVSMALLSREADEAATAQDYATASTLLSELLLTEIDAPWEPDDATMKRWAASLRDAQASHRWNPEGKWPAIEVTVELGDNLVGIRKRLIAENSSLDICTGLIERSNQLGKYLREGQVLRVPTDRVKTLVDLSAKWLFYMHGDEIVAAWPVAIGREGAETTPGRYVAGEKTPEPPWFPAGRSMVPYGDPENPLGTRWISLDGSDSLGIHGTWKPESIGQMASDGCVRLSNSHVEELFEVIPKGTEVWLRP
jgi:hypothetical protein